MEGVNRVLWHRCRCGTMIPQGVAQCVKCAAGESSTMSRHQEYNLYRRDQRKAGFYISREWRLTRDAALRMYDHLDIYALIVQRRIVTADMVHHIVEIEEDWDRRLDMSNLLPLSNGNHGIISALYAKDERTKRETQQLLFRLIAAYKEGQGGV